MKLAIIYDPFCPKLRPENYSQTYRDMFLALVNRFSQVQHITKDCSAKDINADVIIFYDIHSSHHINIEGIKNHKAVKYEYFNDPHQDDFTGKYNDGTKVVKLGAKKRSVRAIERGIDFIICPYENGYYKYIYPYLGEKLVWFPVAPKDRIKNPKPLTERKPQVLANGHTWEGDNGFRPYKFRSWAFSQPCVTKAEHNITDKSIPAGDAYQKFLSDYAGVLALCDTYVVPKYLEVPLSGAVCFAQYQYEYEKMGFNDDSCIFVSKSNFENKIHDFNNVGQFQSIADAGRKVALNWTAEKFADFIYGHAVGALCFTS